MHGYLHDFAGANVLFAMAANQEYGPHLEKLFKPLMIGIGPVEAALNLSAALTELKLVSDLPDLVVTLGSAGLSGVICVLPRYGLLSTWF